MNDVAIGMDGSVFLAGSTGGGYGVANAGLTDFAVVKLDAEGNEIWRWQVRLSMRLYADRMTIPVENSDCMSITTNATLGVLLFRRNVVRTVEVVKWATTG